MFSGMQSKLGSLSVSSPTSTDPHSTQLTHRISHNREAVHRISTSRGTHTTGTERQTYAGFPLSLVPDRLSHNTSSYFTATFPTNLLTPHRKSHSLPNAIITATAIPPPLNLELLLLLPHGCHVNRFSCCFHSHQQFHHVVFPPWLVFVHVWAHYSIPGRFITLAFLPFPMPKNFATPPPRPCSSSHAHLETLIGALHY